MSRVIKIYWKSIIIAIFIFFLSVIDFSSVNDIPKIKYSDKIVHVILYFIWTSVIFYETIKSHSIRNKKHFFFLLFIPIFFGGCIEMIQQAFFPPRTAEWFDWFADILGTFWGSLMTLIYFKRQ